MRIVAITPMQNRITLMDLDTYELFYFKPDYDVRELRMGQILNVFQRA